MNPDVYLRIAANESTHWWSLGRRDIISKMIAKLGLPKDAKILEVGCGTGGNLRMLSRFGKVSALEMDAKAREIASRKTDNLYEIRAGHCPDKIGFHDLRFDLICMFDVLEHIEEDSETLIALKKLLTKDGCILITVPAYQWLWSKHDEILHHKRRYSLHELSKKIMAANLQKVKISYFNTILFPLVAIIRIKDRLLGRETSSGTAIPFAPVNKFLRFLFGSESCWLQYFNFPFGVSLLCILKLPTQSSIKPRKSSPKP